MGITAEYDMQVALTKTFIDTDPEVIEVYRSSRVRDPSTGAWKWQAAAVPEMPQTVRIMEYQTTAGQMREVTTPGGEAVMPELYLLAMPDANLKRYDTFSWHGYGWQIDEIHFKPDYELRCDVVRNVS